MLISLAGLLISALLNLPPETGRIETPQTETLVRAWEPVEAGYAFVDGEALSPPFEILASSSGVEINGHLLASSVFESLQLDSYEDEFDTEERDNRSGTSGESLGGWLQQQFFPVSVHRDAPTALATSKNFAEHLAMTLDADGVVIVLEGQPILTVTDSEYCDALLYQLVPAAPEPPNLEDEPVLSRVIGENADLGIWNAFAAGFSASPELTARVTKRFEFANTVVKQAATAKSAVELSQVIAYPLTVLGMLLAIGGFGHLLRSVPQGDESSALFSSERLQRATIVAVALIAAFSVLDLTWTIVSARAGTMRELNPIGGHLIQNPVLLTLFKASATAIGCGLLYHLRQNRRAADAAWWMCLLMTFVTFRWVMFNSMFV